MDNMADEGEMLIPYTLVIRVRERRALRGHSQGAGIESNTRRSSSTTVHESYDDTKER